MTTKKNKGDTDWIDEAFPSTGSKSVSKTTYKARCYESHPAYEVSPGYVIYGGSCSWPIVTDASVYGGFDGGMHLQAQRMPWHPEKPGPVEFLFRITDMQAPKDAKEFRLMVEWLAEQLKAGEKVHIGCIGGHGRTGTVLAALRKHMTGDENATQHVREHYCQKAVESTAQIKFLKDNWGIAEVKPTKSYSYGSSATSKGSTYSSGGNNVLDFGFGGTKHFTDYKSGKPVSTGKPLQMANSIWG